MAFSDMADAAKVAHKQAKHSDDPLKHKTAAILNEKASRAAFDSGDAKTAKKHARVAKYHRDAVDKLDSSSDSESESKEDAEENPLLAWTKAKQPEKQ